MSYSPWYHNCLRPRSARETDDLSGDPLSFVGLEKHTFDVPRSHGENLHAQELISLQYMGTHQVLSFPLRVDRHSERKLTMSPRMALRFELLSRWNPWWNDFVTWPPKMIIWLQSKGFWEEVPVLLGNEIADQVQLKTCLKLTNLCKHVFVIMATNVFNNKELR